MCRKNVFYASVLMAFGSGVLISICIDSAWIRLVVGSAAFLSGFFLLKRF